MKLGTAIKRRRESARLSQLELALQMGEGVANPSDISRIENGKQWPTEEKLVAIAKVFGCPVYELFMDEEYEPPAARRASANEANEAPAAYILGDGEPSIDSALRAVEFELPGADPRTQAIAAAGIYNALVAKQSADRIVEAINGLVIAVEQLREQNG